MEDVKFPSDYPQVVSLVNYLAGNRLYFFSHDGFLRRLANLSLLYVQLRLTENNFCV